MPEAAAFDGVSDRAALQEFSVSNGESFWAAVARRRLSWTRPFHAAAACDLRRGDIKWFAGGQLNVSGEICVSFASRETLKVAEQPGDREGVAASLGL